MFDASGTLNLVENPPGFNSFNLKPSRPFFSHSFPYHPFHSLLISLDLSDPGSLDRQTLTRL